MKTDFPLTFGSIISSASNKERFYGTCYSVLRGIGRDLKSRGIIMEYDVCCLRKKQSSGSVNAVYVDHDHKVSVKVCISDEIKGPFRFDGLGCKVVTVFDDPIFGGMDEVETFGDIYGCQIEREYIETLIERQLLLARKRCISVKSKAA